MSSDQALLLHGQPGDAHDWDAVVRAIGGRVPTLALDRPGWDGRSRPLDLAGNAEAALAALDEAGIERATIVGHSLGAAIAAWLAAERPERVSALVLAAPSANCDSLNRLDDILATPFLGPVLITSAFTSIGLGLRLKEVRRRISARSGLPERYLRDYARTLVNPITWHSFTVEQRMLVRELPVLEERLPRISAPTTVVTGTADRIVMPSSVRRLAKQIPNAQLVELYEASHLLLQDRPTELAELIIAAAGSAPKGDQTLIGSSRRSIPGQDSPGSG